MAGLERRHNSIKSEEITELFVDEPRDSPGDAFEKPTDVEVLPIPNPRRQYALRSLENFAYPVELRTLAAHVVAARDNLPIETIDDDTRERMAIRLHHIDIPALTAADLVAYNPESRMRVRTISTITERYADGSAGLRQFDAV
jgi:hypothetical protein